MMGTHMEQRMKKAASKRGGTHGLFIGINDYPGSDSDLNGCVNDAIDYSNTFNVIDKKILLNKQATKSAIVREMVNVLEASRGETAIITFSGHGSWVPDQNGDEPDGRDEVLVPWDYDKNYLIDDEIFNIFQSYTNNTHILFITDACHSGTVYRMAPPLGAPIGGHSRKIRFLPPAKLHLPKASQANAELVAQRVRISTPKTMPGLVHISGCSDTEFSYDANFNGRPNGALTYVALKAYRKIIQSPTSATYEKWFKLIRAQLPSQNYPQTPQINATRVDLKRFIPH